MAWDQIAASIEVRSRRLGQVAKLLRELGAADQDRADRMSKLQSILKSLERASAELSELPDPLPTLPATLQDYGRELAAWKEQSDRQFGVELESEVNQHGMSLSGRYPELKCGLFTIELDFAKRTATLWYGPKQERLAQSALAPKAVADALRSQGEQLGATPIGDTYLSQLRQAYQRAVGSAPGEPAPIVGVLFELSHLRQDAKFRENPTRETYRDYSRAEFSYDLYRLRQWDPQIVIGGKLRLHVAPRALARRRSDFLWVPDDERTGAGTVYSHVWVAEVER